MVKAYLGLGSNLKNPIYQILIAIQSLKKNTKINIINCSSIYKSPPFDLSNQPDYYNLALKIQTSMDPMELLKSIKEIEIKQGRKPAKKWSSRIIDIDILLYNNIIFESSELIIPHNALKERNFFLKPLIEITKQDFHFNGIGCLKPFLREIKTDLILIKSALEVKKLLKKL